MTALIGVLIYIAIVVLVAVVVIWAVEALLSALGGPPIGQIVRIIVILIAVLVIVVKLLPFANSFGAEIGGNHATQKVYYTSSF
jgi:hypothetical protein